MHRACGILKDAQATTVLVGGVMLLLTPVTSIGTDAMGILSSLGTARPFDKAADGLVRGEACGGILLEMHRSEPAVCFATLHGSHSNADNLGLQLGQPDQGAQEDVIATALLNASVPGGSIAHAEMHGEPTARDRLLIMGGQVLGPRWVTLLRWARL